MSLRENVLSGHTQELSAGSNRKERWTSARRHRRAESLRPGISANTAFGTGTRKRPVGNGSVASSDSLSGESSPGESGLFSG
jgi:hypothetical protein